MMSGTSSFYRRPEATNHLSLPSASLFCHRSLVLELRSRKCVREELSAETNDNSLMYFKMTFGNSLALCLLAGWTVRLWQVSRTWTWCTEPKQSNASNGWRRWSFEISLKKAHRLLDQDQRWRDSFHNVSISVQEDLGLGPHSQDAV